MSNIHNEAILENLFDESYDELYEEYPPAPAEDIAEYTQWLTQEASKLASLKFEEMS